MIYPWEVVVIVIVAVTTEVTLMMAHHIVVMLVVAVVPVFAIIISDAIDKYIVVKVVVSGVDVAGAVGAFLP